MADDEFSTEFSTGSEPAPAVVVEPVALESGTTPAGCEWPVSFAGCGECDALTSLPPDEAQVFIDMAIGLLWEWTGRVFGVCPTEIRPCSETCAGAYPGSTFWGRGPGYDPGFPRNGSSGWTPVLIGGQWYNMGCACTTSCSCAIDGAKVLNLPGPVDEVTTVTIDGVVLPPSAYRLERKRSLIRTDGGVWPACQDLLAEPPAANTFEVTYDRGVPVPVGGQVAAGRLACELAKASCSDSTCALPERLQTITRQGITVGFMDTFTDLKEGGTGIWIIDAWTTSVSAPRPTSSVRSVDVPRR
jgi:hypothetical protein